MNKINGFRDIVESRDFLSSVLENMTDGILVTDMKGIIVYINKAMAEILDYDPKELIGKHTPLLQSIEGDTKVRARMEIIFKDLIEKGKVTRFHDLYKRKDGKEIPVDIHITLLKDQVKRPIGSIAVVRDISQRERIQRELRESEERFRNLVEIANDGIIIDDGKRNITLFNRKAEEIFGYKKEEVIGKNVSLLLPPRYRKKEQKWYNEVAKTGVFPLLNRPVEMPGLRKDGSEIPLEFSFSMHRTEKGGFSIGVIRDISERKKLEKELIEKEKLAALMEMAGATAHELNQPLTTILGATEILMRKTGETDPYFKQLSLIAKETQRLSAMIKKIRKVVRYETKTYLNEVKIIDLDKSSKK